MRCPHCISVIPPEKYLVNRIKYVNKHCLRLHDLNRYVYFFDFTVRKDLSKLKEIEHWLQAVNTDDRFLPKIAKKKSKIAVIYLDKSRYFTQKTGQYILDKDKVSLDFKYTVLT